MELALIVGRLLVAVVFLVAGLAKLADRSGTRTALINFGVPAGLVVPLGFALPVAELAVAVALVPSATAWWGAAAALVLLLLFIAGIGANLARGRAPDCHCFGQLHSEPVGPQTLARTVALAGIAAFLLSGGRDHPGPSPALWLSTLTAPEQVAVGVGAAGFAILAVEGWFLIRLLRQNGRLLSRLEAVEQALSASGPAQPPRTTSGLPVGSEAPGFELPDLSGRTQTLDSLLAAGKPALLIFTNPGCGPCAALMPEVAEWQYDTGSRLTLALISGRGNGGRSPEPGPVPVLVQKDHEVEESYRISGTPSAVLVRPDGLIGSPLAAGAESIRALRRQVLGLLASPPLALLQQAPPPFPGGNGARGPAGPRVGDTAPEVMFLDVSGKTVRLADFRGAETLLLFWNSGCGFCQQMLPDLQSWEANPPEGAPRLLVVLPDTGAQNQVVNFRSPVVIDRNRTAAAAFGASGTPMALLVDADGTVASELAAGAEEVLALAGAARDPASPLPV